MYALVIVNGSPPKEFKIQKGLCQGDPLSLFLFINAVESLHISLFDTKTKGICDGIEVGCNNIDISHQQFANDAIIMGKWCIENAKNLFLILRCFNLAFGLMVNFLKSQILALGHLILN